MAGTARSTPGSRGKVHTQRRAGREEESQGSSRPPMLLLGVGGKGPPFSRQLPKGGPGAVHAGSPRGWGGRQRSTSESWEGVDPITRLFGWGQGVGGMRCRHPRPSPQWSLIRSKVPTETHTAVRSTSAPWKGWTGPSGVGEPRGR